MGLVSCVPGKSVFREHAPRAPHFFQLCDPRTHPRTHPLTHAQHRSLRPYGPKNYVKLQKVQYLLNDSSEF